MRAVVVRPTNWRSERKRWQHEYGATARGKIGLCHRRRIGCGGAVIALHLAQAGAQVTICGRRLEPLQTVAASHSGIRAVVADITDEAAISAAIAQTAPDIVIANAGASESAPFVKTELAAFERMMTVNLTGTFLTLREGARAMQGKPWGGRLIAIASTAGLKGYPPMWRPMRRQSMAWSAW